MQRWVAQTHTGGRGSFAFHGGRVRDEPQSRGAPSAQPVGSGQADASAPTRVRITEGAQVLSTGPGGNRAPCLASASPWCPDTWTVWTLEGVREHRAHGRRREDSGGRAPLNPSPPVAMETPCQQRTSAGTPRMPRLCFQPLFWALLPSLVLLCFCYIISPPGPAVWEASDGLPLQHGGLS